MNTPTPTPTPTPRTDAATYPADCLGKTLVTNRNCSRALERELAALTAERDELRAELAAERARLDWFYEADIASQDIRAAIDAAMKEDAK